MKCPKCPIHNVKLNLVSGLRTVKGLPLELAKKVLKDGTFWTCDKCAAEQKPFSYLFLGNKIYYFTRAQWRLFAIYFEGFNPSLRKKIFLLSQKKQT